MRNVPTGSVLSSVLKDLFLKVYLCHLCEYRKKGLSLCGVLPGGGGAVYVGRGLLLKLPIRPPAVLEFGRGEVAGHPGTGEREAGFQEMRNPRHQNQIHGGERTRVPGPGQESACLSLSRLL